MLLSRGTGSMEPHKTAELLSIGRKCSVQGFAYPVKILTTSEAACLRQKLEEYEQRLGGELKGDKRFNLHVLLPWAWDLVHHPTIVKLVQGALGTTDVYCWSTDINLKEPKSDCYFTWHQDSTYAGIDPPTSAVTAWLALSDSSLESGCVECIPYSHRAGQLQHEEGRGGSGNVLSRKQEICKFTPNVDAEKAISMLLQAGELSLHSFLTVHRSHPNTSDDRRIGLALRYVSAHACKSGVLKEMGTLVSGRDTGLFELVQAPKVEGGDLEIARHAQSMECERKAYLPPGGQYQ